MYYVCLLPVSRPEITVENESRWLNWHTYKNVIIVHCLFYINNKDSYISKVPYWPEYKTTPLFSRLIWKKTFLTSPQLPVNLADLWPTFLQIVATFLHFLLSLLLFSSLFFLTAIFYFSSSCYRYFLFSFFVLPLFLFFFFVLPLLLFFFFVTGVRFGLRS